MKEMRMAGRLSEIEVFVKVVETGSFSAAAQALRLSPSAVSKIVARIEARLGLPLAIRSTRKLRLTPEGEDYVARGRQVLEGIEKLETGVRESAGRIAGRLRVSCNVPFGMHRVAPLIPEFLAAYPGVEVDFLLSDTTADLIRDGIDVAVRTGIMADSTIRARRLLSSARHVVASPDYLKRMGRPDVPQDLARHNCLTLAFHPGYARWPFRLDQNGTPIRLDVAVRGNLSLDNGESLRDFARRGAGIARLSEFHVGSDMRDGTLVPILQDFNPGDTEPVWVIYADQSPVAARVRAMVDFLADRLSEENS